MLRNLLLAAALSAAVSASSQAAGVVYAEERGSTVTLGNDYLERAIGTVDGHVGSIYLRNKLSGSAYALSGDEFELSLIFERLNYTAGSENPWIVTARDLQVRSHRITDTAAGGKQVVFQLASAQRGGRPLEIELTYELKPDDFFTRQWVHLVAPRQGTYFVDSIAVAKNHWGVAIFSEGGYGQPLYAADLFLGLEYPTSRNLEKAGEAQLGYRVGLNIPREGLTSETAVIGVSAAGGVGPSFQAYVDRIRAARVRPYILYNSWYDMRRAEMTSDNLRGRISVFDQLLLKKYGIHLDSFVLDDGWDDMQQTWAIDAQRFPNGFRDLASSLEGINSRMGIWFGPIGGYGQRNVRIAAARKNGLEITSNGQYLCLAGTRYGKLLNDTMLRYQKEFHINYFKLDGMPFGCNEPDHGHPVGIYSDEAQTRAFIGMLQRLRAQDPSVFLNVTTGIWLSPWWLKYADTVFMGGADSGYLSSVPALAPRQSAVSYRDSVIYDDFVANHAQFPISSIMTHGIIKGRRNMLGGQKEKIDDWIDEVVHYMSVGNMMMELYISPDVLSPEELGSLAAALHWAEANAHPLLDNTTLALGDPSKREPYAYVHTGAGKSIVTLRNPFVEPQTVRLKVDAAQGFHQFADTQTLEFVYPYRRVQPGVVHYGDTLSFELGAYEQRVCEMKPVAPNSLQLEGVRFSAGEASAKGTSVRVYAPAGSTQTFRLTAPGVRQVLADGEAVTAHDGAVTIRFGGSADALSYSRPSLEISGSAGAARTIRSTVSVQVPADYREARLAFLIEPEHEIRGITAEAHDSGKPVEVVAENGGRGVWHWFPIDLQPGSHAVELTFRVPASPGVLKLSAWLLSKRTLASRELSIQVAPGGSQPKIAENLLPASTPIERQTAALLQTLIP